MERTHFYYLDLLRVFLTILVFCHHSAIAFGAPGGWYYIATATVTGIPKTLLSLTVTVNQSYFMSLFFFISAFLMPVSYDRKGAKAFVLDRLNRLGIPLFIYTFLLNPLLVYWLYDVWWVPGLGPMWFVFTLLLFELAYAACRFCRSFHLWREWSTPTVGRIILFILVTGLMAFWVRLYVPVGSDVFGLQLGYFPLYIGMYLLGIAAQRDHWLDKMRLRCVLGWFLPAVLVGIPLLMCLMYICMDRMPLFNGGWNLQALSYALWDPVMCVGISGFLLAYGKAYCNVPMPCLQRLSADSYAFYFIHPFVVVAGTLLVQLLPLSPLWRLLLVVVTGIPCCFVLARVVRLLFKLIGVKL